jgi:UDP-2-acetamido-2,6-beta-L-arabino-hexul-4-ose reductase
MKVLVVGSKGFIGKNLMISLKREKDIEFVEHTRQSTTDELASAMTEVDFVYHLAGVNRPAEGETFSGNVDLTQQICDAVRQSGRAIPILYTSSIQAEYHNEYGESKYKAEQCLLELHKDIDNPVYIYRLPNVFGKWCRPNYNSVVATFCHNIANDLPIQINDPQTELQLVHIGSVITSFLDTMYGRNTDDKYVPVEPVFKVTLGELAETLYKYKQSRENLITEPVGHGFTRVLYATYISYITPDKFNYSVKKHEDNRGVFVEMLKTRDSGQFSFFTAHPGITRGGHYHHCKTEKFLVLKGTARFGFRHIVSDETCEIITDGDSPQVVETVPGWSHDITNIGEEELIVMLWANENFDSSRPDTVVHKV